MDLQFIAEQLLLDNQSSDTQSSVNVNVKMETMESPSTVAVEPSSAKTTKLSLGDYLLRKKHALPSISEIHSPDPDDSVSESSESDSDEDMSDDDSESEVDMTIIASEGEEELEEEQLASGYQPKTVNEIVELPPVEPLPFVKIPDDLELAHFGEISSIVDTMVLVEASPVINGNLALDTGSMLILEDRSVLGEVFEVFGPIQQPFYLVRFNSVQDIDTDRIFKGAYVYQNSQFSKPVFTDLLRKLKGSDASNIFDEEIPEEDQEFSDDEFEQEVKAKKKNSKSKKRNRAADSQQPIIPARPIQVYEDTNISNPPPTPTFNHVVPAPQPQFMQQPYNVPYYNYQPYPYMPNGMVYNGNPYQYPQYPPPNYPYPWPPGYNHPQ